jgi:hypothetical protein
MTHFVIQTDGDRGVLLVDGQQPELFGALVAVDVRRDPLLSPDIISMSPTSIRAAGRTVVEVTLRLPLGLNDTLTVVEGSRMEDVQGPTVDGNH